MPTTAPTIPATTVRPKPPPDGGGGGGGVDGVFGGTDDPEDVDCALGDGVEPDFSVEPDVPALDCEEVEAEADAVAPFSEDFELAPFVLLKPGPESAGVVGFFSDALSFAVMAKATVAEVWAAALAASDFAADCFSASGADVSPEALAAFAEPVDFVGSFAAVASFSDPLVGCAFVVVAAEVDAAAVVDFDAAGLAGFSVSWVVSFSLAVFWTVVSVSPVFVCASGFAAGPGVLAVSVRGASVFF